MAAVARTSVLPKATLVGALSAQLRRPRQRSARSANTSTPAVHLTSIRDVQSLSTNVRRIRWGFTAIVQVTARNRKVVASTFAMSALARRSTLIRSRISAASWQSGPEHSKSTRRRSSSASGHPIRLTTSPPSTRKTMCPGGYSARRSDGAPHPSSGGRISLEKTTGEARQAARRDMRIAPFVIEGAT